MNKRNMFPLLVALCIVGALVLTVGVSQARFRENWTETLPFQPEGEENLILHQDGDWIAEQNTRKLTFSLENTDTQVSEGKIYILVSEGIEAPEKLNITLTAPDGQYIAQAQPIVPGSVLHMRFGDGWAYRFLNTQGQEKTWTLQPSGQQSFDLTVEHSGEINYHSLLRVVATKAQTV